MPEAHKPTEDRPDLPSTRTRYGLRHAGSLAMLANLNDDTSEAPLMLLSKETSHDPSAPKPASEPASLCDPKNRSEAMSDDPEGWSLAEQAELANHATNGSFK